jgi:hypothetical protein
MQLLESAPFTGRVVGSITTASTIEINDLSLIACERAQVSPTKSSSRLTLTCWKRLISQEETGWPKARALGLFAEL